ncbi:rCG46444 [Rattus norvegicus]|uniref:RCG46444 n=1 Tax=Rattus norvegicus TaxID=10116 RepID=A6ID19_RAT|nr:rCG46444 [Rattus norvegicus]
MADGTDDTEKIIATETCLRRQKNTPLCLNSLSDEIWPVLHTIAPGHTIFHSVCL